MELGYIIDNRFSGIEDWIKNTTKTISDFFISNSRDISTINNRLSGIDKLISDFIISNKKDADTININFSKYKNKIDEIYERLNSNSIKLDAINSRSSNFDERISNMENKIRNLEQSIKNYDSKNIVL